MDNRAQISAELIIVIAAVLAIALILIKTLGSTSKTAAGKLNSSADKLMQEIEELGK